jgi:hypothetical protein
MRGGGLGLATWLEQKLQRFVTAIDDVLVYQVFFVRFGSCDLFIENEVDHGEITLLSPFCFMAILEVPCELASPLLKCAQSISRLCTALD